MSIFNFNLLELDFVLKIHRERELVSEIIRNEGVYSRHDIRLMKNLLNLGDVFVDGGANLGWHTIIASKLVGPSGRVLAFEPENKNAALLETNLELNGIDNVAVVKKALGDRTTVSELSLSQENFGNHILGLTRESAEHTRSQTVEVVTLDEACEEYKISGEEIGLVKLDIQGSEIEALSGSTQLLKQKRFPIIAEYSPKHFRAREKSFFDFLSFIDRYNYQPFLVNPDKSAVEGEICVALSIEEILQLTTKAFSAPFDLGYDFFLSPLN